MRLTEEQTKAIRLAHEAIRLGQRRGAWFLEEGPVLLEAYACLVQLEQQHGYHMTNNESGQQVAADKAEQAEKAATASM